MSGNESFYLEEYKALRSEITEKLKDRLEFSRWGLFGVAAIYSYILAHPGKAILFWVPVGLAIAMVLHLNEEHRMIVKVAEYIKTEIETWATGVRGSAARYPIGWETYLKKPLPSSERWPAHIWAWTPVPLWLAILALTLVVAVGTSAGWFPSLTGSTIQL